MNFCDNAYVKRKGPGRPPHQKSSKNSNEPEPSMPNTASSPTISFSNILDDSSGGEK